MALIITVTKVSVTGGEEDVHNITLNLKVIDDTIPVDVIDKNFTVEYKISHDSRGVLRQRLIGQMQKEIDNYKNHKVISDSSALANDITTIQSSLLT